MNKLTEKARELIRDDPALADEVVRLCSPSVRGGLTARQRELFIFISEYERKHGFTPSFTEMRDALSLASKSGVHRLVEGLVARGCITRMRGGQARSISLLRSAMSVEVHRPEARRDVATAQCAVGRAG